MTHATWYPLNLWLLEPLTLWICGSCSHLRPDLGENCFAGSCRTYCTSSSQWRVSAGSTRVLLPYFPYSLDRIAPSAECLVLGWSTGFDSHQGQNFTLCKKVQTGCSAEGKARGAWSQQPDCQLDDPLLKPSLLSGCCWFIAWSSVQCHVRRRPLYAASNSCISDLLLPWYAMCGHLLFTVHPSSL